jgi:hypothetical protein
MLPVLLVGALLSSVAYAADAVRWDFEDSTMKWQPRADSIKVRPRRHREKPRVLAP